MVDTLTSLRQDFPNQPLLLFIGCDAFNHLTCWHQWRQLFTYAHLVVITRPSFHAQALGDFFKARLTNEPQKLAQERAGKLFFQHVTSLEISATAIRKMIAEKHNPGFLLPDAVIDYIERNGLYQTLDLTPH
jgi:nicotinate-nucleotide adenylyltransferase